MNNLKNFTQYVNEVKSERELVRDLARRLSLDKDVIKYLNTSRAKREIGWRELLQSKLHGNNLNYINYITKNMVADYNPQITGYINIGDDYGTEGDEGEKTEFDSQNPDVGKKIRNMEKRIEDIEDVLGIDPEDHETVDVSREKLGLNPFDEDENEDEDKNDKKENEETKKEK